MYTRFGASLSQSSTFCLQPSTTHYQFSFLIRSFEACALPSELNRSIPNPIVRRLSVDDVKRREAWWRRGMKGWRDKWCIEEELVMNWSVAKMAQDRGLNQEELRGEGRSQEDPAYMFVWVLPSFNSVMLILDLKIVCQKQQCAHISPSPQSILIVQKV